MRGMRPLAGLAVAVVLGGCVYYNGMYNAKRLANSARKAERDGRAFEATNLWGQVVVRAETLLARHPDSKYVDEALVLKGLALSRMRQCQVAVAPLGHVALLPEKAEVTTEAQLALEVDDLDTLIADLKGKGVTFQSDVIHSPVCRMAVCLDSEGNSILLHQLKPKGGDAGHADHPH